jgi:hypothetical protein
MDVMSRADDTIQIHKFLLDTKITKCRGQRPCTKGFGVQGEHGQGRFLGTVSENRRLESRYLQLLEGSGSGGAPRKIRHKAMKYVLIGDDMFYRTLEGLLLKCLGPTEANRLLHEVHEGARGTHQSAHKMKWLIRRSGYYWSTMLEDSFKYYKGCQACQRFGKIQMVPASVVNSIIKPWPFKG